MIACENCGSSGWVCENHPDHEWAAGDDTVECCGGAGMPCPECNDGPEVRLLGEPVEWLRPLNLN